MENFQRFEAKARLLKALSHPVRLCIARGLLENGACNVTKMHCGLNMPQSTISQHLLKLKEAGIIHGERKGVEIFYSISSDEMRELIRALKLD